MQMSITSPFRLVGANLGWNIQPGPTIRSLLARCPQLLSFESDLPMETDLVWNRLKRCPVVVKAAPFSWLQWNQESLPVRPTKRRLSLLDYPAYGYEYDIPHD